MVESRAKRTNASEQEPKTLLKPHEQRIADFFNASFFFSQGQMDQQERIMYWLIRNGHTQDLTLPEETPDYILQMLVPRKHADVSPMVHNQLDMMFDKWSKMQYDYQSGDSLERRRYPTNETLIEALGDEMVSRDFLYQTKRPRPGREEEPDEPIVPDSTSDPRASLLRRFVINRQPTGIEPFDAFCSELQMYFAPQIAIERATEYASPNEERRTPLGKLQQMWEQHHPGIGFFADYQETADESFGHEPNVLQTDLLQRRVKDFPTEPKRRIGK